MRDVWGISQEYIRMCEKAPNDLWHRCRHTPDVRILGTLLAARGCIFIIVPTLGGTPQQTPELRIWLDSDERLLLLKKEVDYGGDNPDRGTPIYREDQLQRILIKHHIRVPGSLARDFTWWLTEFSGDLRYSFDEDFLRKPLARQADLSMRGLWFAYFMHELYGREWDGEAWVKE